MVTRTFAQMLRGYDPRPECDDDYPALDRDDVDTGEDCDALERFYAAREVSL